MRKAEERVNAAAEKDEPRLRRQFLDALDGAFSSERPFTGEWLQAPVDHSHLYLKASDPTQSLLHYVDNTQRFRRAIYAALNAMEPVRGEVFEEAVTRASELSLLCAFFCTVVGDNNTYAFLQTGIESILNIRLNTYEASSWVVSGACRQRLPSGFRLPLATYFGSGGDVMKRRFVSSQTRP